MAPSLDLMSLSGAELDTLFAHNEAGELPNGFGRGEILVLTGTRLAKPLAWIGRMIAWRGKRFAADGHSLRNVISPFGVSAIAAAVYHGESRVDGKSCIVLDYSKTSWVAKWIRDEIREMAPGRYIGMVFLRSKKLPIRFALNFDTSGRPAGSTTSAEGQREAHDSSTSMSASGPARR